jgi:hypothetical protein
MVNQLISAFPKRSPLHFCGKCAFCACLQMWVFMEKFATRERIGKLASSERVKNAPQRSWKWSRPNLGNSSGRPVPVARGGSAPARKKNPLGRVDHVDQLVSAAMAFSNCS